jgi:hypothetical protein
MAKKLRRAPATKRKPLTRSKDRKVRRTAQFRKRSAAAKRGWETRRKNARKAKRAAAKPRRRRQRDTSDQGSIDRARPTHYRDLDDWIDSFESWDGDYDFNDYDTGVDTGGAD